MKCSYCKHNNVSYIRLIKHKFDRALCYKFSCYACAIHLESFLSPYFIEQIVNLTKEELCILNLLNSNEEDIKKYIKELLTKKRNILYQEDWDLLHAFSKI